MATSPEAATLAVASNYRSWRTDRYRGSAGERLARFLLDRAIPKALIVKDLGELTSSDSLRALALVAHAAPGHLLEILWEQLRHHIEGSGKDIPDIAWLHLEFPLVRANLRRDLEAELALQLGADRDEPVKHLLHRQAPRAARRDKKPVLWLNWGVFGSRPGHQQSLNAAQLGEWLRFSSEYLAERCPDDLRIVSYLALEIESTNHEKLTKKIDKLQEEPWCDNARFWLRLLPPLELVKFGDLHHFLADKRNTECDSVIQAEIARRIIAKTDSNFEQVVELIEQAERTSWYDLHNRLRCEQGVETPDDEEPF